MFFKKNKIFKTLVISVIVLGLCFTTIQIGAMSTTQLSDEFVRPVYRKNIPLPEKVTMSEIKFPLTVENNYLPTDIPVASTEDSDIHPAITNYGNGLLFGGYTRQASMFDTSIEFVYSGNGGSSWEDASGLNPDIGLIDYVAMDNLGTGSSIVVTFQPDPAEADGSEQWRIIMEDPLDSETWDGSYWDWTSHGYSDIKKPDIAGYDFNGEGPEWYYGMMVQFPGSVIGKSSFQINHIFVIIAFQKLNKFDSYFCRYSS